MLNLLLLLLQLIGGICAVGAVLSTIGIFLGRPLYFKGAEAPNDWRAAVAFAVASAVCFGIVYLAGRKNKKPE